MLYPESGNFTGLICASGAAPAPTGAELSTAGTDPVNGTVVCGIPIVLLEMGGRLDGAVEGKPLEETVEGKPLEGTVEGNPDVVGGGPEGKPDPVGGGPEGAVPVGGSPGGACRRSLETSRGIDAVESDGRKFKSRRHVSWYAIWLTNVAGAE